MAAQAEDSGFDRRIPLSFFEIYVRNYLSNIIDYELYGNRNHHAEAL